MKRFTFLLIQFLLIGIGSYSQKSAILTDFYKTEYENFEDFIRLKNERANPDTSFDVTFYHLKAEVSIDRHAKFIKGSVLCKFKSKVNNLSGIRLSLDYHLDVDSITGNSSAFSIGSDSINIILDKTYQMGQSAEVCIWYQGVPRLAGGYKGLRYETHHNGEPVIATLSTPYLAHYWYPCKDGPEDKADSVYFDITVPDTIINGHRVIAVSNGLLENSTFLNGKVTYCWRHRYPIVTYYTMIAISNYSHFQQLFTGQTGESFPIDYYVFKEHDSISQAGVYEMPEVMQFFSTSFGTYPFRTEKYAMSELGYYGAIENQTNTIINNMSSDWFSVSVHELAHMWFGDMITCSDWHHAWMNEGFATYAEALWLEHKNGISAYQNYFNASPAFMGGTLYLPNDLDTFNIFQGIVYTKGAWVLHMLRGFLGDPVFFNCLKTYAGSPGFMYKNASTEDFRDLCENLSGKDLSGFFDQWVYDQYYPEYHYNFIQDSTSGMLTLHIFQAQESLYGWREVFEMPLQLKITDVNGNDTLLCVFNNGKNQEYSFQFSSMINHTDSSIIIDPERWIICKTHFDPSLPIGINDFPEKTMHARCYPNPATDQITIESTMTPGRISFSVYDQFGRNVRNGFLHSSISTISLGGLINGMYFLTVGDGTSMKGIKFLKQ